MRNREIAFVLRLQNETAAAVRQMAQDIRAAIALTQQQANASAQAAGAEARAQQQLAVGRARIRREQASARNAESQQVLSAAQRENVVETQVAANRARLRSIRARAREAEARASISGAMLQQRAETQAVLQGEAVKQAASRTTAQQSRTEAGQVLLQGRVTTQAAVNGLRIQATEARTNAAQQVAAQTANRRVANELLDDSRLQAQAARQTTAEIKQQQAATTATSRATIDGNNAAKSGVALQREQTRLSSEQQRNQTRAATDLQRLATAQTVGQRAQISAQTAATNGVTAQVRQQRAQVQLQQQSVRLTQQQAAAQAQVAINAARTATAQARAQSAGTQSSRAQVSLQMQQMRQQALQQALQARQAAGGGGGGGGGGAPSLNPVAPLMRGAGAILAVAGGAQAVTEAVKMADEYRNLAARVKLVTDNETQHAAVMERLSAISMDIRVTLKGTADTYYTLARSNAALGLSQNAMIDITKTINQTIAISGTTAASAAFGLMQLGQAFGTGQLRGEELNSVLEQMPRLAQAIAEGLGKSTPGALKALAEEGKLTVLDVVKAIQTAAPQIQAEFAKMPLTVSQGWVVARNGLQLFIASFDDATGATNGLGRMLATIGQTMASPEFREGAAEFGNKMAEVATFVGTQMVAAFRFLRDNIDAVVMSAQVLGVVMAGAFGARIVLAIRSATLAMIAFNVAVRANPFVLVLTVIAAMVTAGMAAYAMFREVRLSNEEMISNAEAGERALQDVRDKSISQLREMSELQRNNAIKQTQQSIPELEKNIATRRSTLKEDTTKNLPRMKDELEGFTRQYGTMFAKENLPLEQTILLKERMVDYAESAEEAARAVGVALPDSMRTALNGMSPLSRMLKGIVDLRRQIVATEIRVFENTDGIEKEVGMLSRLRRALADVLFARKLNREASLDTSKERVPADISGDAKTKLQSAIGNLFPDMGNARELLEIQGIFDKLLNLDEKGKPLLRMTEDLSKAVGGMDGLRRAAAMLGSGYSKFAGFVEQETVKLRDQTAATLAQAAAYEKMFAARDQAGGAGFLSTDMAAIAKDVEVFSRSYATKNNKFLLDDMQNPALDRTGQAMPDMNDADVQRVGRLREIQLIRDRIVQLVAKGNEASAETVNQAGLELRTVGMTAVAKQKLLEFEKQAAPIRALMSALSDKDGAEAAGILSTYEKTLAVLRNTANVKVNADAAGNFMQMAEGLAPAIAYAKQLADAEATLNAAIESQNPAVLRAVEAMGGYEAVLARLRGSASGFALATEQETQKIIEQTQAVEASNRAFAEMFKVRNASTGAARLTAVSSDVAAIEQAVMEFRQAKAKEKNLYLPDETGRTQIADAANPAIDQAATLQKTLLLKQGIATATQKAGQAAADAITSERILRETSGLTNLSAEQRNKYLQAAIPLLAMVAALSKLDAAGAEEMRKNVDAMLKDLQTALAAEGSAKAGNGIAKLFMEAKAELAAFRELASAPIDMRASLRRVIELRREIAGAAGTKMDDPGVITQANELAKIRFEKERIDLTSQKLEQVRQSVKETQTEQNIAYLTGTEYEAHKATIVTINELRASGLGYTEKDLALIRDGILPAEQEIARTKALNTTRNQAAGEAESTVRELTIQAALVGKVGQEFDRAKFYAEAYYDLQKNSPGGIVSPQDLAKLDELVTKVRTAQAVLNEKRTFAAGMKEGIDEFILNAQDSLSIAKQGVTEMATTMSDAIVGFAKTGKFAFKDFALSVIANLMKIISTQLILNAVQGVMGLLPGGGGGATTVPPIGVGAAVVRHTGGMAGDGSGARRTVPNAVFAGAARYHTGGIVGAAKQARAANDNRRGVPGLKPNEVPIIALKNEAVLPTVVERGERGVRMMMMRGQEVMVPLKRLKDGTLGLDGRRAAVEARGAMSPALRAQAAGGAFQAREMGVFSRAQRFHTGGVVGGSPVAALGTGGGNAVRLPGALGGMGGGGQAVFAPSVVINIEGGAAGGDADAQAALAKTMSRELDAALEMKMNAFAERNMRPGGLFSRAADRRV